MIIITPAFDCSGTEYVSHAKGWFYFGVKGLPLQTKHKFVIRKMNQLSTQVIFQLKLVKVLIIFQTSCKIWRIIMDENLECNDVCKVYFYRFRLNKMIPSFILNLFMRKMWRYSSHILILFHLKRIKKCWKISTVSSKIVDKSIIKMRF